MTVHIPKGATFLGVPIITVRNVLKAWKHGSSSGAAEIAKRKDVDLDPRLVMILLEEFRDRELIGPEDDGCGQMIDGLTDRGRAVVAATGQKRISKSDAQKILDGFVANCVALNRANSTPFSISKVWLFGSLIDPGKADVGDIDIVVELEDSPASKQLYKEAAKAFDIYHNFEFIEHAQVKHRLLYGKQRHSRLAPNDISTLRDLACPCQVIFDRMQGSVNEPMLPKHPLATVRAEHIDDKLVFPDLSLGKKPLRPLPVDLDDRPPMNLIGWLEFGPWEHGSKRYLPVLQRDWVYHVTTAHPYPRHKDFRIVPNKILNRVNFDGCEGRRRFGFISTGHYQTNSKGRPLSNDDRWKTPWDEQVTNEMILSAFVIERYIKEAPTRVEYIFNLVGGQVEETYDLDVCHAYLFYIATADIEHIHRRDKEVGISREITISVGKNDPSHDRLANLLRRSLTDPIELRSFSQTALYERRRRSRSRSTEEKDDESV